MVSVYLHFCCKYSFPVRSCPHSPRRIWQLYSVDEEEHFLHLKPLSNSFVPRMTLNVHPYPHRITIYLTHTKLCYILCAKCLSRQWFIRKGIGVPEISVFHELETSIETSLPFLYTNQATIVPYQLHQSFATDLRDDRTTTSQHYHLL